jgi:hypothetical protein
MSSDRVIRRSECKMVYVFLHEGNGLYSLKQFKGFGSTSQAEQYIRNEGVGKRYIKLVKEIDEKSIEEGIQLK